MKILTTGSSQREFLRSLRPPWLYYAKMHAYGLRHFFDDDIEANNCKHCGRKEDFIFHFVKLIPIFRDEIIYVCDDHGDLYGEVLTDCFTARDKYLHQRSYLYRTLRNILQGLVLKLTIAARFIFYALKWILDLLLCEIRMIFW